VEETSFMCKSTATSFSGWFGWLESKGMAWSSTMNWYRYLIFNKGAKVTKWGRRGVSKNGPGTTLKHLLRSLLYIIHKINLICLIHLNIEAKTTELSKRHRRVFLQFGRRWNCLYHDQKTITINFLNDRLSK
jgi:hypothetical protein